MCVPEGGGEVYVKKYSNLRDVLYVCSPKWARTSCKEQQQLGLSALILLHNFCTLLPVFHNKANMGVFYFLPDVFMKNVLVI